MVTVTRTEGGGVVPGLDQGWDDLTKLQWLAAVVAHDTGLRVAVHPAAIRTKSKHRGWRAVAGMYSINVGHTSTSAYTYREAWVFLSGVSVVATPGAVMGKADRTEGGHPVSQDDYSTPHDEPWEVVIALSDAFWLEPQEACEGMRRLAERGFRVVPTDAR